MKFRWKFSLGLGVATLLFAIGIALTHYRAKRTLERYKNTLIEKGEKLSIVELIPPPVDGESNGSKLFIGSINGLSLLNQDGLPAMTLIEPGKARVTWANEEIRGANPSLYANSSWLIEREKIESAADDLVRLREAVEKRISFRPQYEAGFTVPLPHLVQIKKAAQWLSEATIFNLHENQPSEVLANLNGSIRLPAVFQGEPIMISQLVRMTTVQIAFAATWEALQFEGWTDAQLKELQSAWSQLDLKDDPEESLAMERAMGIQVFEQARNAGPQKVLWGAKTMKAEFDEVATELFNDPKAALRLLMRRPDEKLWQLWWSYEDEKFLLNFWQESIEAQRVISSRKSYYPTLKSLKATIAEEIPDRFLVSELLASSNRRFFIKRAIAETEREMAIAACALERYRIRPGAYPIKLEELVPEFLEQIPRDMLDGEPLKYKRNGSGTFVLYSVGEDGKDDGGDSTYEKSNNSKSSIQVTKGRDWVWPERATEAEIKKWEEEQSKRLW